MKNQTETKKIKMKNKCKSLSLVTLRVYMLSFCLQISLLQGLRADAGALMSLCEKTDNDIRSCINTLQVCDRTLTDSLDVSCVGRL